jgi:hypothetical protein
MTRNCSRRRQIRMETVMRFEKVDELWKDRGKGAYGNRSSVFMVVGLLKKRKSSSARWPII